MAPTFLTLLLIFSLLSVSSSAQTLTKAAAFLSDSGYASMSLALHDLIASLDSSSTSQPPSLTVFAPSNSAFASHSGEPSLDLIRFHLVPAVVPLLFLPFGATLPTLLRSHSLTVTAAAADGRSLLSLNNVTVDADLPILYSDDLVIFAVEGFFRCACVCSAPPRNPSSTDVVSEAIAVLKPNGFRFMAAFLNLQFLHEVAVFDNRSALTVFAPVDRAMKWLLIGEPSRLDLSVTLQRHVVPWQHLSINDLASLEEGSQLMTSDRQGRFVINVSRRDGVLVLNGVPVVVPEIYNNGWLVIHGVGEFLDDEQRSTDESSARPAEVEVMRWQFKDVLLLMLSLHLVAGVLLKLLK